MRIQPSDHHHQSPASPTREAVEQVRQAKGTTPPSAALDSESETVSLDPRVHRVLWWIIGLIALSNAFVLVVFAHQYARTQSAGSLFWLLCLFILFHDDDRFLWANGFCIAVGYAVLGLAFIYLTARMTPLKRCHARLHRSNRSEPRRSTLSGSGRLGSFKDTLVRGRQAVGVRGAYFELRLLCEEWFELATQTFVAFTASRSISNVPLNLTYAFVIFANSVSSLFYTWLFRKSVIKQRLACVFTDLVLDFVWGTLLPIWLYLPVIELYLRRLHIGGESSNMAANNRAVQQFVILSWRTFAVSVIPFCGSLLKIRDLQKILLELDPRTRRNLAHPGQIPLRVKRRKQGLIARLAHVIMPIYGLGVLLTSLAANEVFRSTPKQTDIYCGSRVHPWFSTREACLVRRINCTKLGISGHARDFPVILDAFDRLSLAEILFQDCPALEMPSGIHRFTRLFVMTITNSTVLAWDQRAELSDAFFSDLHTVYINDVRFIDDPVGFTGLNNPLVSTLKYVHLENTDANRLLPLVGDHWRQLYFFDCMVCGLNEFPTILYHLPRVTDFSLALNSSSSIPEDWAENFTQPLRMLWLDGNFNLTELPNSVWRDAATLEILSVPWTNLSRIPDPVRCRVRPSRRTFAKNPSIASLRLERFVKYRGG